MEHRPVFKLVQSEKELMELFNYNIEAFSGIPDAGWSLDALKHVMSEGWSIYSVLVDKEIIAAALMRNDHETLYTKSTPIKLFFRGQGLSHRIKEFFEAEAQKRGLKKIITTCEKDNFRMISLNETHGYKKLHEHGELIDWEKKL